MDFTIIGAGNMGRGIATRLLSGGNPVVIIDHDNEKAKDLAEELRTTINGGTSVRAASLDDPIQSEAVVLAVYYTSVPSILSQFGDQLAGKIIVDITNPLTKHSMISPLLQEYQPRRKLRKWRLQMQR